MNDFDGVANPVVELARENEVPAAEEWSVVWFLNVEVLVEEATVVNAVVSFIFESSDDYIFFPITPLLLTRTGFLYSKDLSSFD